MNDETSLVLKSADPVSLHALFEPLTPGQREYMILRILGIGNEKAATSIGLTRQAIAKWRERGEYFSQLYDRIPELQVAYVRDAAAAFVSTLDPLTMMLLQKTIEKGLDENATYNDKKLALAAAQTAIKMRKALAGDLSNEDDSDGRSYEEMLLRKRVYTD